MTSPPNGPRPGLWRSFWGTLELIKISHSVFALPFALSAMLVAEHGVPTFKVLFWILWCLVSARTAAMAFNRWADWDYDVFNPRTKRRSQLGTRRLVMILCVISLAAFVFGCAQLNFLCLMLCPVACLLVLGYSLTKRFTAYTHAVLGLALAAAPMGAWAATVGNFNSPLPRLLAAAVWCWVFGFDLIYATQDVDFDRQARLHSYPARCGVPAALRLARILHILTWLILLAFGWIWQYSQLNSLTYPYPDNFHRIFTPMATTNFYPYWIAMGLIFMVLIAEHILCRSTDLVKLNIAFFELNALVGLILIVGVAATIYLPRIQTYFLYQTMSSTLSTEQTQ